MIELEVGQYYRNQNGELIYIEEWQPEMTKDIFYDQDGNAYYENGQEIKGRLGMRIVCEVQYNSFITTTQEFL